MEKGTDVIYNQLYHGEVKIPGTQKFANPTQFQVQIKGNIKASRHWPLCGEFTGDR